MFHKSYTARLLKTPKTTRGTTTIENFKTGGTLQIRIYCFKKKF